MISSPATLVSSTQYWNFSRMIFNLNSYQDNIQIKSDPSNYQDQSSPVTLVSFSTILEISNADILSIVISW